MKPGAYNLLEREEPRSRLEEALNAARGGRGRVVSIEGEAGIGKTSLALSFADAHRRDARVYIGGCEQLATPEPLGPLRDIARESHGRFSISTTSQLATFEALLALLISARGPALLLLEDLHWADDSTLDLFRYLGRRIRTAPILAVATFRNDEASSHLRLAALWADMPRDCRERIELQPLSPAAVSTLAGQSGRLDSGVYEVTRGNPFFVTEFLATQGSNVPHNVRDATMARISRLSLHARRTLECASIFPRQIDQETLRIMAEDANHAGVEECMRGGMLNAIGDTLAFRHELARRAVHEAMPPLRRRELHCAALELRKAQEHVRAAEVAHHAQQAGAREDLVHYSLRAADEADVLGAHSESVAHLAKALEQGTWLSNAERAALLERQAETGEQCGAFEVAVSAIEKAICGRRLAGDIVGLGNALRISSRLHWQQGQSEIAERLIEEALEILCDRRETWQYAMALSSQSQLDMLANRADQAIQRGLEAMARAEVLGRSDIYLHALTNVSAAQSHVHFVPGAPQIVAAITEARRRQQPDLLPRLYVALVYTKTCERDYEGLFRDFDEAIAASVARDNAPLEAYIRGTRAMALLDRGRAQDAIAEAELVIHGPYPRGIVRFPAQIALARARIRTGVSEEGVLEELRAMLVVSRDILRSALLAVVDAEALWLGLPRPGARERLRAAFDAALRAQGHASALEDTALWLTILGEKVSLPEDRMQRLRAAPQAHIAGAWRQAAQAWSAAGRVYEQAIALSAGDEKAQREALVLFDRLGAVPAAARLRRQMRASGARAVPRGPIAPTRASPVGLTRRQSEVLLLLIDGLNNGAIAERLAISAKTVEHHVSAIIARLGARTRQQAADAARKRGLCVDCEK